MITAHAHAELLLVTRLYVLPEFQRQGIGKMMMDESYRALPQTRQVRVDVEEQNPKGRAFYRKLGFMEVGMKTDDVAGTTLNSVVMERHLHNAA
jgi:ribosomal protein S18 acetylase RimI-like enzyme